MAFLNNRRWFLVYSLFYLGRADYNLANYDATLSAVSKLIKITAGHDQFLADSYSLGADAYAKLGRDDDARRYYGLSIQVDPTQNHWALTGLVGE